MIADITKLRGVMADVKSALFVLPENPTFDAVAGSLALSLGFRKNSISTSVSCPSPMLVEFNRLVGVDKVRGDLGESNLVISLEGYPPDDIERVSYAVDGDKFNLVVLPKAGTKPPGEDQVKLSYSGGSFDLVVVVGANSPAELGKFSESKEILETRNLALLAAAPSQGWPKVIELIDPKATSISEVVYDLFEQLGFAFDQDIATNLFSGIEAGTQGFSNSGAEGFEKAARLLREGARRSSARREHFHHQQREERTPGASPRMPRNWPDPRFFKGPTLP